MPIRYRLSAALASVALAASAYFFLPRRPPQTTRPTDTGSGYADPATCRGCHAGIARTYERTGMGRSLYSPGRDNTVEDYQSRNSLYHRASDRYYTMTLHDGRPYQRRHQVGFGGKETNVVEKQVDYVIGSGNHARSYLHRTTEGKLVEFPVSWYAEKGGYWAMSPGYDRPDQKDFRRAIAFDCLFCHNGYPQGADSATNEPLFKDTLPQGIDCQRCHGPGGRHVEAAGSGKASTDSIRAAILNPGRLDRDRQVEVCMQCHLEPTSGPLPNVIPRFGRGPFSYRPGAPLADSFVYFDHAPDPAYDDKFEIAHAAYRLRKSACFQASKMTCTTCHNPHEAPRAEEAARHYDTVCRSCHAAAHQSELAAKADCIACHMPRRRAEDAVHVVMTDHYIQRRRPARDLLAPVQEGGKAPYRGEVKLYYPAQIVPAGDGELYVAIAQVQDGTNLAAGIPRLRQAIEKYKPEAPEFYFELGKAYSKAGNPAEAITWCERALQRRGDFRPAAKELAVALIAAGDLTRAAEALEKAASAPPADAVVFTNLGNIYLRQGNIDKAEQVLRKALSIDPDLPDANNLVAMAASQRGDRITAEKYFRQAISVQPDLAEAHNNLANLLATAGDHAQAAWHFERAIAMNPAYAQAHYRYGLLLILTRSYEKALRELQQAVRLDPAFAPAHNDLADMLAAKGRVADAAAEYRLAIQSDPNHYEAHLALGMILARQGAASEARTHLEKAAQSDDPNLRQAALKALH